MPVPGRLTVGEWALRVFVAAFIVILLVGIWAVRNALMLIFLSAIVAIALMEPVRRFEQMGLNRGLSLVVTVLLLLVGLYLVGLLLVSTLIVQAEQLFAELPDTFNQARDEYDRIADDYGLLPQVDWESLTSSETSNFLADQASELPSNVFPFLSGVGGVLANLVFIVFIALFFVGDPTNYLEGMLTLVPQGYRPRALEILVDLGDTLRRWFVGQLISMLTLGSAITIVDAFLLDLPNPVALGVIAGIMEFVPNFGSIISVIPAVLFALADDPAKVPLVILAYLITQQIQSNLIMPRIMTRQINMPSAVVLSAQVIAAALFGFIGLLLALPLAVVCKVILREVYVFDVLNTRPAQVLTQRRSDGRTTAVVVSERYRPEQLSPGEAAQLQAQGYDIFAQQEGQTVEIVTPASPALERAARGQQAVWVAVFTLAVAQGLALIRTVMGGDE